MCPICKNRDVQFKFELYDDRYGYPDKYKLYKCRFCNHQFINNNFSPEKLIDLYSKYYPRSQFKVEKYKPHVHKEGVKAWFDGTYSSAYQWVPKSVRILDIGCGFCETLGYHTNRGCDVYGVEADVNVREVAEKFNFKVKIGLFEPTDYKQNFFDYVTMDQVIEHTINPIQTLKDVKQILKPGGHLIISTPNANGWGGLLFNRRWINWHVPYHLHFFSKSSIGIAAKKAGLIITEHHTITKPKWLHYQLLHLITYPKNGEPSNFWKNLKNYNFYQKIFIKLFSLFDYFKIFNIFVIAMDLFRVGDNQIIVLSKQLNDSL